MKKYIFLFAIALTAFGFIATKPGDITTIDLGTKAPKTDVKMTGTDDKSVSLNDLKKANGLLVVFSCNTCPFVIGGDDSEGWEGRYNDLQASCDAQNIGLVLVNSNEAKRSNGDNLADMKAHAKEKGYSAVKYVLDTNSELANAFGARTTPHAFLFDKDMKLVYKGAIDDNVASAAKVTSPYLKNAIQNLGGGKKIDPADTKPVGCGIKRVS